MVEKRFINDTNRFLSIGQSSEFKIKSKFDGIIDFEVRKLVSFLLE